MINHPKTIWSFCLIFFWLALMASSRYHAASSRGGNQYGHNPIGFDPVCGKRFGDALLGRGHHGKDLDSDTEYGEYPWHVGILATVDGDTDYVCGGALLDGRHILTAAHCIKSFYPHELLVRVGDWDVNTEMEVYSHMDIAISDVFIHERFFAGSLHNDIAVLRLARKLPWDDLPQVSPICLPHPQESYTGQKCWVTGWGKDAFHSGGKLQARLQEVDVPVIGHKKCERILKREGVGKRFQLHPGWLCAGGESGKDACSGDGGGPLVCQGHGESMELAGLVSWGIGCGKEGVPGVYTNVAAYVNWIKETVSLV